MLQPLKLNGSLTRTISTNRLKHIQNAKNKEDAIYMGIVDRFKNWLCDTQKPEVMGLIYELTHGQDQVTDPFKHAVEQTVNFLHLDALLPPDARQNLLVGFSHDTSAQNPYQITLQIPGLLDLNLQYGDISAIQSNITKNTRANTEPSEPVSSRTYFKHLADRFRHALHVRKHGDALSEKKGFLLNLVQDSNWEIQHKIEKTEIGPNQISHLQMYPNDIKLGA
jgi:hypothetical protein